MDRMHMTVTKQEDNIVGGEVSFSGIDEGNAKPITVKGYNRLAGIMVVKVPGGSHWTGNYMPRSSHRGHYKVLVLEQGTIEDSQHSFRAWANEAVSWPLQ